MKKSLIVKIVLVIVVILVAILIRMGISSKDSIMNFVFKKGKARPETTVVVDTVKEADVVPSFEAPGRVVSKYQVSIMARISGYLQKSFFKEGDYVKAGETLFLIEPVEYQNASNVAGANIQNIKAQLEYANKQLVRAEELVKQDYIAKSRYDEILANRNALQAQLKAAESSYNDSNRNLAYTRVKAPVDGRIGIIDVTVGNYVTPSSGSLTTINSTNPIYVTFPLSSDDYSSLISNSKNSNETRKTELYFKNGDKYNFDGVQDFLDNKVDMTTGTVTLRATFQNPENRLIHGEFVTVKLYSNQTIKVPVVPLIAVQENQEGKFVYTVGENNMPQLTYVKVQGQSGDNWIIKEGIKPGDRIIVEGVMKVIPGSPIKIITKEEYQKTEAQEESESKENNK